MKRNRIYGLAILILALAAPGFLWFQKKSTDEISQLTQYHFLASPSPDRLRNISTLESRASQKAPQAIDLGLLAALYYSEGQSTGVISWYEKAEAMAKKSLQLQPIANAGTRVVLAKVLGAKHAFQESIDLALDTYKEDSSKSSALSIAATSYLALGNLVEAGVYADQWVDQTPGLESYALRAVVMEAQGRQKESFSDFKRALQIEDIGEAQESAWARCMFARSLMKVGDYDHAYRLLEESLKIIPDFHLAYDLLGDLSQRKGELSQAEKYFNLAFQSSKQLAYLVHLSKLKTLQGQTEVAREIQTQAETLIRGEVTQNGYGHRLDLASILIDRGQTSDLQEALKLAEEEVKIRQSALALSVLAKAQLASGQKLEARKTVRSLLRSGVRDSGYYSQMAMIEKAVNNSLKAAFYMKEAVDLEPQNQQLQKLATDFQRTN